MFLFPLVLPSCQRRNETPPAPAVVCNLRALAPNWWIVNLKGGNTNGTNFWLIDHEFIVTNDGGYLAKSYSDWASDGSPTKGITNSGKAPLKAVGRLVAGTKLVHGENGKIRAEEYNTFGWKMENSIPVFIWPHGDSHYDHLMDYDHINLFLHHAYTNAPFSPWVPPPRDLSDLATTLRGSHNLGEHVMNYGDDNHRFLWGIIFPRDSLTYMSFRTIKLRSGITLDFNQNDVTVGHDGRTITVRLRTDTIYLINEDLSIESSKKLSGIKLKKFYDRSSDEEVTNPQDLEVPEGLYRRFGRKSF